MQDNLRQTSTSHILCKGLIFSALIFLFGCSSGAAEEKGVEEIVLADEDQKEEAEGNTGVSEDGKEAQAEHQETTVFVYICGAVKSPGVYELEPGARVFDAIHSAGGITEDAAPDAVNQARIIADGEQIYIPTADEAASPDTWVGETTVTNGTENSKVNLNTA